MAMNQFGASIRSSPRRVLTFVYRGKITPCNISMSSPNMNMRPYIGDESGIQLVPEPSRLIGSARSMVECISIPAAPEVAAATEGGCISWDAWDECDGWDICMSLDVGP